MKTKCFALSIVLVITLGACSRSQDATERPASELNAGAQLVSRDVYDGTIISLNKVFSALPDASLSCVGAPEKIDDSSTTQSPERLIFYPVEGVIYWKTGGRTFNDGKSHAVRFKATPAGPGKFRLTSDRTSTVYPDKNEVLWDFPATEISNLTVTHAVKGDYTGKHFTFDIYYVKGGEPVASKMNCRGTWNTPEEEASNAAWQQARIQQKETQRDAEIAPYVDIIERVRTGGPNCPTIADHMTAHARRGNMREFHKLLQNSANYGCGR